MRAAEDQCSLFVMNGQGLWAISLYWDRETLHIPLILLLFKGCQAAEVQKE